MARQAWCRMLVNLARKRLDGLKEAHYIDYGNEWGDYEYYVDVDDPRIRKELIRCLTILDKYDTHG